jgi:hypothetical protein
MIKRRISPPRNAVKPGGDDFDMPAHRAASLRVEVAENSPRQADEIAPQERALLLRGRRPHRGFYQEAL